MEERYKERIVNKQRKTNLFYALKKHGIKQYELAQESDLEAQQISLFCNGKKNDMLLSTAKRICNSLNDLIGSDTMVYTLHDIFGEKKLKK